jgi:hypothetical protein
MGKRSRPAWIAAALAALGRLRAMALRLPAEDLDTTLSFLRTRR